MRRPRPRLPNASTESGFNSTALRKCARAAPIRPLAAKRFPRLLWASKLSGSSRQGIPELLDRLRHSVPGHQSASQSGVYFHRRGSGLQSLAKVGRRRLEVPFFRQGGGQVSDAIPWNRDRSVAPAGNAGPPRAASPWIGGPPPGCCAPGPAVASAPASSGTRSRPSLDRFIWSKT